MNNIFKMSNAGGMDSALIARYSDMLAGNATYVPYSPTGAFDSLATVTVGASAVSSVTFSGIPNTYTHLHLRGIYIGTANNSNAQFNGDSGSNYSWHYLDGTGATVTNGAGTTTTKFYTSVSGGNSTVPNAIITDIFDYTNVNKYKTVRSLAGNDKNGSGDVNIQSGLWMNTTAITSITIAPDSGTFSQYSSFALYGVK